MLHGGHVSGLEKPSAGRRESAYTVFDPDVFDPGNSKMVHFKRKDEEIAEISSMAARQGHRYNRRIEYD